MQTDERAFFQTVETRILMHRGRGYALSGIDAHKVLEWWQAGHPLAMVLAAVEAAAKRSRRLGHRDVPSIAMVVRCLDELAERRSREGTGDVAREHDAHEHRGWARLRQIIEGVGKRLEDGAAKDFWRGLWTRLVAQEASGADAWDFAREADLAVVNDLAVSVPESILAKAADDTAQGAGFADSSPRARDEMLSLSRAQAIRTFLGLPELLEALLYP